MGLDLTDAFDVREVAGDNVRKHGFEEVRYAITHKESGRVIASEQEPMKASDFAMRHYSDDFPIDPISWCVAVRTGGKSWNFVKSDFPRNDYLIKSSVFGKLQTAYSKLDAYMESLVKGGWIKVDDHSRMAADIRFEGESFRIWRYRVHTYDHFAYSVSGVSIAWLRFGKDLLKDSDIFSFRS